MRTHSIWTRLRRDRAAQALRHKARAMGRNDFGPDADDDGHVRASDATTRVNTAVKSELPLDDTADFEAARRGFVAVDDPLVTTTSAGQTVWDRPSYDFIQGEAPPTVNPSLWRQAQLNNINGLFQVTGGIHQVRGYDLANMSTIEGRRGRILVDPLTSVPTARRALALVNRALGERPVTAIILTHSHVDHFGGIRGGVSAQDVESGRVRLIAPSASSRRPSARTCWPAS
jgi:alkyl sulfatase BDS1-like metallo-beta-lactamase superfamily hydrolase